MSDALFPWQLGEVDATPQQMRRVLQSKQDAVHRALEFADRVGRAISELVLGLRPDIFIGIELRRVGREAIDMQPAATLHVALDRVLSMDRAAVPQQDDVAAQMPQ